MVTFEKLPKWLCFIVFVLALLSILSLIKPINLLFPSLDTFALLITLIVLIIYTYFTYQIAKYTNQTAIEPQIPIASFSMEMDPQDPYHVFFIIQNHSKVPIDCWCKLNPKVQEELIQLDNFYGGKSPFKIQPYGKANGHFKVSDIISKSKYTMADFEELPETQKSEKLLNFNIDFYYNKIGTKEQYHNPPQPCFYSFTYHLLILDF
jgi:hypothetical protein